MAYKKLNNIKVYNLRMEQNVFTGLEYIAAKELRSVNDIINFAIKEYIEKYKANHNDFEKEFEKNENNIDSKR